MTRSVTLALLACAVGAWASATNGPKPEKALGKKGCDICSGGTVDAYAHAGSFCKIADDVFDLEVTEAECYHDHSNSWISRTCGEVAHEYMEANLNANECKSVQESAAFCCSDAGGGNAANLPRPTSKPTGPSSGSGPGDGDDGKGPRGPPPGAVMVKWEDVPLAIAYMQTVKDDPYLLGSAVNWTYAHSPGYDEGVTLERFVELSRSVFAAGPTCAKFEVTCRVPLSMNVVVGSRYEGDAGGASDGTADPEPPAGATVVYAPDMSTEGLVEEVTIGDNTIWKVLIPCGATGGMHTYASKEDAEKQAKINLLSHYPRDHAVWNYPCAAELKEEAMACSAAGGRRPPRPQLTGATANFLPYERQVARANCRTVRQVNRREDGVRTSRTFEIDPDGVAEVRATVSDELRPHIEQFLGDVATCESPDDAEDVEAYVQGQMLAEIRLDQQRVNDMAAARETAAEEKLRNTLRQLAIDSGWTDLTDEEFIPEVEDKEVSFLASRLCPAFEAVRASYYGHGGTGPRDGHDKRLKLYRKVLKAEVPGWEGWSGWQALVLARVPELHRRIKAAKNRHEKKAYLDVLKFLVEKSQIDHIWSSTCDAPPNCILEWGPVNNLFKDFKHMPTKLRRYGANVKRESIAWMDECIDAESKCLPVA